MLIEFLGLPGSGKSTVAQLACEQLAARGIAVRDTTFDLHHRRGRGAALAVKAALISRFALRAPYRTLFEALLITRTQQKTWNDLRKVLFNWLFVSALVSKRRSSDEVIVLDQGIAQALWSVAFAARSAAGLECLAAIAACPTRRPDLIFHVRAGPTIVARRLSRRAGAASRMDGSLLDPDALSYRQQECDALALHLRAQACLVVDVQNDGPEHLEVAILKIMSEVLRRLPVEFSSPSQHLHPSGSRLDGLMTQHD